MAIALTADVYECVYENVHVCVYVCVCVYILLAALFIAALHLCLTFRRYFQIELVGNVL